MSVTRRAPWGSAASQPLPSGRSAECGGKTNQGAAARPHFYSYAARAQPSRSESRPSSTRACCPCSFHDDLATPFPPASFPSPSRPCVRTFWLRPAAAAYALRQRARQRRVVETPWRRRPRPLARHAPRNVARRASKRLPQRRRRRLGLAPRARGCACMRGMCRICQRALTPARAAFGVGLGVGGCVTYALVADGRLPLPSGARRAAAPAAAPGEVAAALAHPAAAHGLPSSSETLRVRTLRVAAALFAWPCAARAATLTSRQR